MSLLALLALFLALCWSPEAGSMAVPSSTSSTSSKDLPGPLQRIFMQEEDASNFFRTRSRRAIRSQDEIDAEQRQVLAADERKREFHEEKRNKFERFAEEEHDEQDERSRESGEQWREFHYDGMNPPYE